MREEENIVKIANEKHKAQAIWHLPRSRYSHGHDMMPFHDMLNVAAACHSCLRNNSITAVM